MTILYLCNGKKPDCKRRQCFLDGGACSHTLDVEYARNFDRQDYRNADGPQTVFVEVSNENTHIDTDL